jgi:hypothetical protein
MFIKIRSFAVITILFSIIGCQSTPLTKVDKEIAKTYQVPNMNKKELFHSANMWMAKNYNSSQDVIQYSNEDSGTIIGKGIIPMPCDSSKRLLCGGSILTEYTMTIEVKDNKFRTTFENLQLLIDGNKSNYWNKDAYEDARPVLLEQSDSIFASMIKSETTDNW